MRKRRRIRSRRRIRRRKIQKGPRNRQKLRQFVGLGVCIHAIKQFLCQNPYGFAAPLKIENLPVSIFFKLTQTRLFCIILIFFAFFLRMSKGSGKDFGWPISRKDLSKWKSRKVFFKLTQTRCFYIIWWIFFLHFF